MPIARSSILWAHVPTSMAAVLAGAYAAATVRRLTALAAEDDGPPVAWVVATCRRRIN